MKMRRLIWTLIAAAGLAFGQDQPKMVKKIIEVRYADPQVLANLVNPSGRVNIRTDRALHVMVVEAYPDALAEIEAMVKKLDVAPANIEMTVYLISGNARDATDDLPKDLASTAKQLHAVFAYKSYRILQSFVLRDRESGNPNQGYGAPSTSGTIPGSSSTYDFLYRALTVSGGTPRSVHIDGLRFSVQTPTGTRDKEGRLEHENSTINTDLDIGDGQKVVVGKSNLHGSDDALILVITAQVVQ
jgi:hypothetical protein